ncbi:MAG: ABC-F family ATP-binding cassette domain-containing protein [Deltaproteobacteria bacterium]|nr:ABC-F family ATP-binding cassette domain-containing protein [Deltaproteobacteria bacterium]
MISVENLTKSYGTQVLFERISLKINPRERVGLVGRNGHGKTTLFRLIVGDERPDSGAITIPKHHRIGYVRQRLEFTEDTVLKEGMKGLPEEERDHHWKVEKILAGLGFSPNDLSRHPEEFSGGYQVRLNLAKVLVSEPDLLLLDEPTNYLDITSIRWVEHFLLSWPRELILITHDRGFMDKVVTHTMAIHRKKVRKVEGNTEKLYAQIAQQEEIYEKTRINDDRRRKKIEEFISRFRAKARLANLVQSRIKTLEKKEKLGRLERIETLDFSFRSRPYRGKYVMSARDVSFSYDPKVPLIRNFNITIGARDRVCVIGRNGKGKTTLLRLLAADLKPDAGEIVSNPGVTRGFFEQTNIASLNEARTVEEEIFHSHPDVDRQLARNIGGAMMFEGDAALKKIAVLSGGEKARVMLGKILAAPVNLLLLDEPTNHLDMFSCDSLLAAIASFEGTVVMVTHNEMFLDALADRLIVFQHDEVCVFEGGYQRFLEKGGWENEVEVRRLVEPDTEKDADKEGPSAKLTKKEVRRRRSEIITERGKVLKPIKERIARVEHEIESRERELNELSQTMLEASQAHDGERIAIVSQSIHKCQPAIDKLFYELEEITSLFEQRSTMYEKRLAELE